MPPTIYRNILLGMTLYIAASAALILKPNIHSSAVADAFSLDEIIPRQFGEWRIDVSSSNLYISPAQSAVLLKIYNQTLTRTYINDKGDRIMLSLAYGGDQSDSMRSHKPEVCYPAQGFEVIKLFRNIIYPINGSSAIPVKRMVAVKGNRVEPVTYWTLIGDRIALDTVEWKLAQIRYGLSGYIPDGLLFRVSSINPNEGYSFLLHDGFINQLINTLGISERKLIAGNNPGAKL